MENKIKQMIMDLGADVIGIGGIDRFTDAPKGFSPTDLYPDCKSVISFGVALSKGLLIVEPRLIYAHFNDDVCIKVDEIALKAAKEIEKLSGGICVPIPCDAPNEYWDTENLTAKGLISMKHTAVLCGLGQLGKSTLLLNPQYGNRLILGAILTNLELESDPFSENICIPGCNKCMNSCPVHAIGETSVNQKLCRPHTYGKTKRGFATVDCNTCRYVCPVKAGIDS